MTPTPKRSHHYTLPYVYPNGHGPNLYDQVDAVLGGHLAEALAALKIHYPNQQLRADLIGASHTTLSQWETQLPHHS